jgi:aspartate kinase
VIHTFTDLGGVNHRKVMKFGGAALATAARIRGAAARLSAEFSKGNQVIAVVSAMGDETDRLVALAAQLSSETAHAEVDSVLASGEQVSAGLMALALQQLGIRARSFLAHQIRVRTDGCFGNAGIVEIETERLEASLARGELPVIAGFQGVDAEERLVTLGRGGSDMTAVALAVSLRANACELFKDVDGVFAEDPRRNPHARKLEHISYEQMDALVSAGAQVLQRSAVQLAARHGVRLHVRSAFHEASGTWVGHDETRIPMNPTHHIQKVVA